MSRAPALLQRMLLWTANPNKYRIARYLAEENAKKGNKVYNMLYGVALRALWPHRISLAYRIVP